MGVEGGEGNEEGEDGVGLKRDETALVTGLKKLVTACAHTGWRWLSQTTPSNMWLPTNNNHSSTRRLHKILLRRRRRRRGRRRRGGGGRCRRRRRGRKRGRRWAWSLAGRVRRCSRDGPEEAY